MCPLLISTEAISKSVPFVTGSLAVTGLIVFVWYFLLAFQNSAGETFEYSCPLSAMWSGLALLWFSATFLAWWLLSSQQNSRNTSTRKGMAALYVWAVFGGLFAVEGFVAMIGFAVAQNEGAAAGLSVLWIPVGVVCTIACTHLIRLKKKIMTETTNQDEEEDLCMEDGGLTPVTTYSSNTGTMVDNAVEPTTTNKKESSSCCGCCRGSSSTSSSCCGNCCRKCCGRQCCNNFWMLFLAGVLLMFSTGFMVQATQSGADANALSNPPGTVYTIQVPTTGGDSTKSVELRMHLNCFGGASSSGQQPTIIFEHGGGANSMTLLGLAQEMNSVYGNRACIYDRLGYGFTPSLYANSGSTSLSKRLPNTGVILSTLLTAAGERGPFVCAGHSAGAEACLWFATERPTDVIGVAMMDGYPDLIRAGSFRPGEKRNGGVVGTVQGFGVMMGATGFTRGLVGNPGPSFVPSKEKDTVIDLYGQTRFWLAQYWDLVADFDLEEEKRLYQQLNGVQDEEDGLYRYGGTLSGVKVLVLPAFTTVNPVDCTNPDNRGEFCCGHAQNSMICQNQREDADSYRQQTELYASTLSSDTAGLVIEAPEGAQHSFVYHADYYQWLAQKIGENLLLT